MTSTPVQPQVSPAPIAGEALPRGIIAYLPTPLRGGRDLDESLLARLTDHLLEAGVHGFSPLGSSGEAPAVDAPTAWNVIRTVTSRTGGQVPVIPGVLGTTTVDAVRRCRDAQEAGAAGIVAVVRPWGKTTQAAIVRHITEMEWATDLPMVLYRQPSLGVQTDLDSIVALSKLDKVVAIKDASTDTGMLLSIQCSEARNLALYAASAHVALFVWQMGGIGWMSGPACVAPDTSVRMYNAYTAGDMETAWALQRGIWPLCRAFATYGPARVVKAALAIRGWDVGAPIAPMPALSANEHAVVQRALMALAAARSEAGLGADTL